MTRRPPVALVILALLVGLAAAAGPASAAGAEITRTPVRLDTLVPEAGSVSPTPHFPLGWRISLDPSGRPVGEFTSGGLAGNIFLARCGDAACTPASVSSTVLPLSGFQTDRIAFSPAGNPVLPFFALSRGFLMTVEWTGLVTCDDALCKGVDAGGQMTDPSLTVRLYDNIATCSDPDQDAADRDRCGRVGIGAVAVDASGHPVLAYTAGPWHDTAFDQRDLVLMHCTTATCTGGGQVAASTQTLDTYRLEPRGVLGGLSPTVEMALDPAGNPVIAYAGFGDKVRVIHCDDPDCAGGNDAPVVTDLVPDTALLRLALAPGGIPVILGGSSLLRCADARCTSGTVHDVVAEAPAGRRWFAWGLALGADGFPVIAIGDNEAAGCTDACDSWASRVLVCDDPVCAPPGDRLATLDAAVASGVALYPGDVVVGQGGLPALMGMALRSDRTDAIFYRCGDAGCTGGDTTPPTSTLSATTAAVASAGVNRGDVTVRVVSHDDRPGPAAIADWADNVLEVRCVLDPAAVPQTFDDLPAAGCPYAGAGAVVTQPGPHVLYAAGRDWAGNVGAPEALTFTRAANTSLVQNGGFESACPGASCGWSPEGGVTLAAGPAARSGAGSLSVRSGSTAVGALSDCITVHGALDVQAWFRPLSLDPTGADALAQVVEYAGESCAGAATGTTTVPWNGDTEGSWRAISGLVTLAAGTGSVRVRLAPRCAGTCPGVVEVLFDDVAVAVAAPPIVTVAGTDDWIGVDYVPGLYVHGPVHLVYTCAPSGISPVTSCPAEDVVDVAFDGTRTATARQANGLERQVATRVRVDRTPPTITASAVATLPGGAQVPYTSDTWVNGPVTITYTCADAGVGLLDDDLCLPETVTAEGITRVQRFPTDRVDNMAQLDVLVKIDRVAPTIGVAATVGGEPYDGQTWTRGPVELDWTCGDDRSGVGTCEPDGAVAAERDIPVTGLAVDAAGNTATADAPVLIDRTPPTVTIRAPSEGARLELGELAFADFACSEPAERSGVAACTGSIADGDAIDTSTAGLRTLTVTARDVAGNEVVRTSRFTVGELPLTVRARDVTVAYGAPLPAFVPAGTGFVLDDGIADLGPGLACTAPTAGGSPLPGTYPITCSGAANARYAISYQAGTLTVTPPPRAAGALLPGPRVLVVGRTATRLGIPCAIDGIGLASCAVELSARVGGKTTVLARGSATGRPPSGGPVTVSVPVDARLRSLARRRDGLTVTVRARALQVGHPAALVATAQLLLAPRLALVLPSDALFRGSATTLPARAPQALRAAALLLRGASALRCAGHTDSRGTAAARARVSRQRAAAVCAYLARVTSATGTAVGRGSSAPRASNATAAGRAQNRRIEVVPRYP